MRIAIRIIVLFHTPATALHSRHCYGDALDVHTIDVDGDRKTEQVFENYAKSEDGRQYGAAC